MTRPKRAPRITRMILWRAIKLLHMEYKPSELAEIINVTPKTIYDTYLTSGLPHRRDEGGNIWIVGTEFVEWANVTLEKIERDAKANRIKLGVNQAYCVRCRTARDFAEGTTISKMSKNRTLMRGKCAVCGAGMFQYKKRQP